MKQQYKQWRKGPLPKVNLTDLSSALDDWGMYKSADRIDGGIFAQSKSLFGDEEIGDPGIPCPDCGTRLIPKFGKKTTLVCPNCKGKHMANADGSPRGIPADKATRQLRQKLHAIMERMKKDNSQLTDAMLYRLLNQLVGHRIGKSHVGQMDATECQEAISSLRAYLIAKGQWHGELVDFSHMPQPDSESGSLRLQQVQANSARFNELGELMTWQQRSALDDLNERLLRSTDVNEAKRLGDTINQCLATLKGNPEQSL